MLFPVGYPRTTLEAVKKGRHLMKRGFVVVGGPLIGAGLLALAGCASSMARATADDVAISSNVKSHLDANAEIKAGDIDVTSSDGVVTLIGRVSSQTVRKGAGRIARDTKGVNGVKNELLIGKAKY
jgi:hypothetical protein